MVTKTLRQQIEDAFTAKGGVQGFVEHLIIEFPAVAAALLSKLLPPVEVEQGLKAAGGTVVVNIQPIASGTYIVSGEPVGEAKSSQLAGTDTLLLEHHAAAPVDIPEPKLQLDDPV